MKKKTLFIKKFFQSMVFFVMSTLFASDALCYTEKDNAPSPWEYFGVRQNVFENVCYLPIMHESISSIPIKDSNEKIVDLMEIKNERIIRMSEIDPRYKNSYEGYSKVRSGLYKQMLKMLEVLPKNIGIAYFEALRPLSKQKEYFDDKFSEIYAKVKDKELSYSETCKLVSPFIDNTPTHATGAAIDMTLFEINYLEF